MVRLKHCFPENAWPAGTNAHAAAATVRFFGELPGQEISIPFEIRVPQVRPRQWGTLLKWNL